MREVLLIERMIRMARQGRMVDLRDMRILREVIHDLQRIFAVALHAQGEGLEALQQQKGIERCQRRARITQQQRAQIGDVARRADVLGEAHAMVARVRLDEPGELAALHPVELTAIDDDAAERRTVTADELRGRMHDDIRPVLDGAQQIWRGEGVVDDQRDVVLMRDCGHGVDVDKVGVRVADGLDVENLRVILNGILENLRALRGIDEGRGDAPIRCRMLKEIVGAAVNIRRCDDVLAVVHEALHRRRDRCSARGKSQRTDAALQRRDALLEDILGRVRQAAIDVARIAQAEAIRRMLAVAEHIGRRLIDRHGTCIRRRIGLLLTDMQLQSFKMILLVLAHINTSFLNTVVFP